MSLVTGIVLYCKVLISCRDPIYVTICKWYFKLNILKTLITYLLIWREILNLTLLITCSVVRIWVHLLISQQSLIFASIIWSAKFGLSIEILKSALLITYYDIKTSICVCRPDVDTSFYIKIIFDFRLDYLIQNLEFEVRFATWRSCFITHIVANLGSSTYNLML